MTTTAHTAVGGVIGACGLPSPVSFALGAASHYPLDLIPHWDLKRTWIDTILTFGSLGALFFLFGPSPVFWGALGGALPDVEHLLPHRKKLYPSHGPRHGRALPFPHAIEQAALILVCAALIVRYGK